MAITLVNSASGVNANGLSVGPVDMAGSSLIVAAFIYYGGGTITQGPEDGVNTYAFLSSALPPDASIVRLYYAENPNVGSPLTFTTAGTSIFNALIVAGFSGVATSSPFDQENANETSTPQTSLQPGSVTPTEDNELIVADLGYGNAITNLAINSGFSTPIHVPFESGVNFGLAFSYLVQTSAAAVNPTFSWTTSSEAGSNIATFKAAAVGGGAFTPRLRGPVQSNLTWR